MKNQSTELSDIDIVFPWVDGSDPEWLASKRLYSGHSEGDDRDIRYRDWGLLKYVFRGIEKNLPWVRKVHFITCGHLPSWLNTACPKLHFVKHEDYIPNQWLPTFSSHTIELNIHRIEGLSERFIYMNDDMFFMQPMKPEKFFVGNKPKSQAGLDVIGQYSSVFAGILYSDTAVINKNFDSRQVIKNNGFKFINIHYQLKENFKTILLLPWCNGFFPCFSYFHGPNPYLKSTLEEIWEKEKQILNETCSHKFREYSDVNQFLFLWWQWCQGNFIPANMKKELQFLTINRDLNLIKEAIQNPHRPMLCLNDATIDSFEETKAVIISAFESVLGEKSAFER